MRGTVEPLMHGPTRRAAHKSTRASSAMAKAAKMRSMENAKQAVCWALQVLLLLAGFTGSGDAAQYDCCCATVREAGCDSETERLGETDEAG